MYHDVDEMQLLALNNFKWEQECSMLMSKVMINH